ncbi:MAG: L-cysteine/cystine lyase [Solirubrobacteraceae bacterium]|jgi:L-cysteine/cystine lyase|nr:L-cysteine/cystine lyase [Solirubrobacteraceae bacterium]
MLRAVPMTPVEALREQFPVFEQTAYLNAGTCGPLPAQALRAGADSALAAAERGRGKAYFDDLREAREDLRGRYAVALGADASEVALTTATSEGVVRVLSGLGLRPGDEVLTAPDEHPGVLGPLASAARTVGIEVRTAPFEDLVEAVEPGRTKLVACSHVSWVTGRLAPAALAEVGREIPVLLDGAQGVGAVPVDLDALGCAFYAGSGQKWLCGPVGTGMLWVSPAWRERLSPLGPTYPNLEDPGAGLDARPWPDARAHDTFAQAAQILRAAAAAARVLEDAGWADVHECAAAQAALLASRLEAAGREVAPRDATTLVSWEEPDPDAAVERLAAAGVVVRGLPGTRYVRASVGAWNATGDLDRLHAALQAG